MNGTHWLGIMPSLPLARAVPVVRAWDATHRDIVDMIEPSTATLACWGDDPADNWRVDLDDPQGFAYALREHTRLSLAAAPDTDPYRLTGQRQSNRLGSPWRVTPLMRRHLIGQTTDADRLALARALREVFGG